MPAINDCKGISASMGPYVDGALGAEERTFIDKHLNACPACREGLKRFRSVQNLLEGALRPGDLDSTFLEDTGKRLRAVSAGSLAECADLTAAAERTGRWVGLFGSAPWWFVSLSLHVLVIALAGLLSMAIELPRGDDQVVMITELQQRPADEREQETRKSTESALESKLDTPHTDPTSKEASDIVIPPDILAKAELGDHFETINPDRPDAHSAYGIEDAKSFHSVNGDADKAGGGGSSGMGMEDVIGIGGAASRGSGGGDGAGIGTGSGAGKGSFGQRNGGGRRLMVQRHGGSKATESAVDKALEWLAYHQEADGHWDSVKYGTVADYFKGERHTGDTGVTGLALLAFLGAGHTEKVGKYRENVKRAVHWICANQDATGRVFNQTDYGNWLGYSHAICAMALAEAAGMARIPETMQAAQKAVDYSTEIHQLGEGSVKGAWRYRAKQDADLSVTGWFVMSLKSAKIAGLKVNPASLEGAMKYLDSVQLKIGDSPYGPIIGYGYQGPGDGIRTSAIGTLCRQFMGWKMDELQGSVEYFVEKYGVPDPKKVDLYYWYYGTLCVFQQGGDIWKKWNEGMKSALLPTQCKDGDDAGSWTPAGEHGIAWGRVGQTAVSALTLEVYYRYERLTADK